MGILFSDSTTKAINNCLALLWMDDAKETGLPRKTKATPSRNAAA